jgi:hypothetical protein
MADSPEPPSDAASRLRHRHQQSHHKLRGVRERNAQLAREHTAAVEELRTASPPGSADGSTEPPPPTEAA